MKILNAMFIAGLENEHLVQELPELCMYTSGQRAFVG